MVVQRAPAKTPLRLDNKIPDLTDRQFVEVPGIVAGSLEPPVKIGERLPVIADRVGRVAPLFGQVIKVRLQPLRDDSGRQLDLRFVWRHWWSTAAGCAQVIFDAGRAP